MSIARRTSFALSIIIVLAMALVAGAAFFDTIESTNSGVSLQTSDSPISISVGPHRLSIPTNYFDLLHNDGERADSILLMALWPNLEPKSKNNLSEFFSVRGWGRKVQIFIENPANPTNMVSRYNLVLKQLAPLKPDGEIFGLFRSVPASPKNTRLSMEEFLVEQDANLTGNYITCRTTEAHVDPSCSDHFEIDGLIVEVSYDKDYLPIWRDIRSATKDLYKTFRQ